MAFLSIPVLKLSSSPLATVCFHPLCHIAAARRRWLGHSHRHSTFLSRFCLPFWSPDAGASRITRQDAQRYATWFQTSRLLRLTVRETADLLPLPLGRSLSHGPALHAVRFSGPVQSPEQREICCTTGFIFRISTFSGCCSRQSCVLGVDPSSGPCYTPGRSLAWTESCAISTL